MGLVKRKSSMSLGDIKDIEQFKEQAEKLPTKRLLAFYKKYYRGYDPYYEKERLDYYYCEPNDKNDPLYIRRCKEIEDTVERGNVIKAILDTREHVG